MDKPRDNSEQQQQRDDALLITRYCDGQLSPAEFDQLNNRLATDPALRELFIDLAIQAEHLETVVTRPEAVFDEFAYVPPQADDTKVNARTVGLAAGYLFDRALHSRAMSRFLAAAVVVLVATLAIVLTTGDDTDANTTASNPTTPPAPTGATTSAERSVPAAPVVARLTNAHDAEWAEGALAPGDKLHLGDRLNLTAGFAEITTTKGAVAILEAPATIELLDSDNAIHLHAGKLVGICETESSKGFVVRTSHLEVTDLGTRFGVRTDPSETQVAVFDGVVDVADQAPADQALSGSSARRTIRLTAGWSASASTEAGMSDRAVAITLALREAFVVSMVDAVDPVAQARRAIFASGPIAYWAFDDLANASATNEMDRSAHRLPVSGPVALSDTPFRRGLQFSGSAETPAYLESREPIAPLTDAPQYTISVWCKALEPHSGQVIGLHATDPRDKLTRREPIALLQISATPPSYLTPPQPINSARFMHRDPPGDDAQLGTNIYAEQVMPGSWVHLVAVKHDDRLELYRDGRLIATEQAPGRIQGEPYALIGLASIAIDSPHVVAAFARPFNGLIDELAIYDRALSSQEITGLYQASQPCLEQQDTATNTP